MHLSFGLLCHDRQLIRFVVELADRVCAVARVGCASAIGRMPFYAVRCGRNPGVFGSWAECEKETKGFPKARYKKFGSEAEAWKFVKEEDTMSTSETYPEQNNANATTSGSASASATGSGSNKPREPQFKRKTRVVHHELSDSDDDSESSDVQSNFGGSGAGSTNIAINSEVYNQLQTEMKTVTASLTMLDEQMIKLNDVVKTLTQTINSLPRDKRPCDDKTPISQAKRFCSTASSSAMNGNTSTDSTIPEIYTDGCCHGNGTDSAKAGIGVYWGPRDPRNVAEPLHGRPTNNRAEIHAAIRAVQQSKEQGFSEVIIKTDSAFLIKSITQWIRKWKKNGWKLSTGNPVINKEDFVELENELRGISVKWVHVRGHQGIHGNEEADRLANEGANKT